MPALVDALLESLDIFFAEGNRYIEGHDRSLVVLIIGQLAESRGLLCQPDAAASHRHRQARYTAPVRRFLQHGLVAGHQIRRHASFRLEDELDELPRQTGHSEALQTDCLPE